MNKFYILALLASLLMLGGVAIASDHANPCNPCAMKMDKSHSNPCNPCGMKMDKSHSNPCNPCGMKMDKSHGNPCNPCNPCGMKKSMNPCMANASAALAAKATRPAGSELWSSMWTSRTTLIKEGEKLFNDTSLGSNGMACSTCHATDALYKESFAQVFPHPIAMVEQRAGVKMVHADEIVQFCIAVPMEGDALDWEGRELAALTAYVTDVQQKEFMGKHQSANPCAMKMNKKYMNPCNPCAMK